MVIKYILIAVSVLILYFQLTVDCVIHYGKKILSLKMLFVYDEFSKRKLFLVVKFSADMLMAKKKLNFLMVQSITFIQIVLKKSVQQMEI